jgi:hypothetical protein
LIVSSPSLPATALAEPPLIVIVSLPVNPLTLPCAFGATAVQLIVSSPAVPVADGVQTAPAG